MSLKDAPINEEGRELPGAGDGDSMIGRVVHERFLVERDLTDHSIGGGYAVLLVKDLQDYCRERVLKIFRPLPDQPAGDGPLPKEVAQVLALLGHRNIEEVVETGRLADGRPFALTELYSATPLDRLIMPEKRLELEGVALLVEQVCSALAAAHSRGILHCDLRPSNILVSPGDIGANAIRIINFGSAWPIDVRGESLADVRPGSESLHFAAPELLVALGHRSAASDVYSVAVLVYRLVTGMLPFTENERPELLRAINDRKAGRPEAVRTDLSPQAGELIMAGLDFEPFHRPRGMGEFGERLVRLLSPPKGIPIARAAGVPPEIEPPPEPAAPEPAAPEPVSQPSAVAVEDPARTRVRSSRAPVSDRAVAWALIILLMAGALSIPIGQTVLKGKSAAAELNTVAERAPAKDPRHTVSYWIDRNSPDRGELAVVSDTPGELFLFIESVGEDGRPAYRIAAPSSGDASGVAVEAGKAVELAVANASGARAVWIVWASSKIAELQAVRDSAKDGAVSNEEDRRSLRHFLERNRNLRVEVRDDTEAGRTILVGSGAKIVHRLAL